MADEGVGPEAGDGEYEPPATLRRWQRIALLCAAIFLLVVGIRSIFRTSNEGATTALVVGGIILVVIAVVGELPLRGSIAGVSWDLTRKLLRNSDRRVVVEAADSVLDAAEERQVPPDVFASAQASLARVSAQYEQEVLDALNRVVASLDGNVFANYRDAAAGLEADAVLNLGGRAIIVEIKVGRLRRDRLATTFKHLWTAADKFRGTLPVSGVLLVTPGITAADASAVRDMNSGRLTNIALWDSPADDAALKGTILDLLRRD